MKVLLMMLTALSLLVPGQALAQEGPWQKKTFRGENGVVLPYRLLAPADTKAGQSWPLVVVLHGMGERGLDNEAQLKNGVRELFTSARARKSFPCFVIAPQCPPSDRWVVRDDHAPRHVMAPEPTMALRAVISLVEASKRTLPVDPSRVYIMGISMGAYGTWETCARRPDIFAAAVPICGAGDVETAPRFAGIPIWAFHGDEDVVVRASHGRATVEALRKAGGTPRYSEYPGVGHASWTPALAEPALLDWMFAQRKGQPSPPFDKQELLQVDSIVPLLLTMLAVPSVSGDRAQCARALDTVEEALPKQAGLIFDRIESEGVTSLVVRTRPSRHAAFVLNAHLDVVPGRPEQFMPRVEGTTVHGRGAYDMKGAAAVYIRLLRDVAAMAPEKRPDLQVHFVTDEEVGGARGSRVLQQQGFTGDFVICGEPTDLDIGNQAKGLLWVTVHMAGRPTHGSRPWQGSNPITLIHQGLAELHRIYPTPEGPAWRTTVTPTAMGGGDAHNRIPGEAFVKLDIRRVPTDDEKSILAAITRAFPGARLEVVQSGAVLDTPATNAHVLRLRRLVEEVTGRTPRLFAEHFASDARFWNAAGVPAVCWGPGGGGIHGDDEHVDVKSLELYYKVLRRLVGLPG